MDSLVITGQGMDTLISYFVGREGTVVVFVTQGIKNYKSGQ